MTLPLFLAVALGSAAQDNTPQPNVVPPPPNAVTSSADDPSSSLRQTGRNSSFQERSPRYQVRVNDVLQLEFALSPEFNQSVRVQPDGYISLKSVPAVHVQGHTIPEIGDIIRHAYKKILHNPLIAVVLTEFQKPYFIATGEVSKPGKYDLLEDTTVVQAVGIAGGFNKDSKHSQVLLFRRVNDDWFEVKQLNVKQMMSGRNLSEDLHLRPGDMVYVPKNTISKIGRFVPNVGTGMTYTPRP
jgi:polysaccharide biosynthesis/export protein